MTENDLRTPKTSSGDSVNKRRLVPVACLAQKIRATERESDERTAASKGIDKSEARCNATANPRGAPSCHSLTELCPFEKYISFALSAFAKLLAAPFFHSLRGNPHSRRVM